MTVWRLVAASILGAVLSGCAAVGPMEPEKLQAQAAAALPAADAQVRYLSPGAWHANSRGFHDVRNFRLVAPAKVGVIVLTPKSIYVEQWEDDRFKIIKRLAVDRIVEAQVDTFGMNEQLVLQFDDYETHSFTFTGIFGSAPDRGKAKEVLDLLPAAAKK